MNKIDLVKEEFPKVFKDIWVDIGQPEEGRVHHDVYGGNPTHCRSSMWTLATILKPKTVLEIGSWKLDAANMIAMAMWKERIDGLIHTFDIAPGGYSDDHIPAHFNTVVPLYWLPHHTTYDTWKYNSTRIVHQEFKQMNNKEIYEKNMEILKKIAPKDGYDLIMIDGDHSYEGVKIDWAYAHEVCHKDTVIIIDDLKDNRHWQVKKFWDELTTYKYDFEDWNQKNPSLLISVGVTQPEE